MNGMHFSKQISATVQKWRRFLPTTSRLPLSIWRRRVTSTDRSLGLTLFLKRTSWERIGCSRSRNPIMRPLSPMRASRFRFVHVSTDEVYGSLGSTGRFREDTPYQPSSPYSASKAASDHLAHAWYKTYGLPIIVSNCSNNYGPYQFPEKLIPLTILNALDCKTVACLRQGNQRPRLAACRRSRARTNYAARARPGR